MNLPKNLYAIRNENGEVIFEIKADNSWKYKSVITFYDWYGELICTVVMQKGHTMRCFPL